MVVDVPPWVWELATWVPVKAKKRKRKVPANSPAMAMKWFRTASGLLSSSAGFEESGLRRGGRFTYRKPRKGTLFCCEAIARALKPGNTKPPTR